MRISHLLLPWLAYIITSSASASRSPSGWYNNTTAALHRMRVTHDGSSLHLHHRHGGRVPNQISYNHGHGFKSLLTKRKKNKVLLRGSGHATFYYEKQGPGHRGTENGVKEYAEMKISTMCEPWQDPKTLEERKSNRIVALPLNKMEGHTKEYCGKEIVAHYRGKTIGGLIAWDGCVACDGNDGLDFSSTVFGQIVGEDNCHAGRLDGLTWELTDNQLWDRNGNPAKKSPLDDNEDGAFVRPAAKKADTDASANRPSSPKASESTGKKPKSKPGGKPKRPKEKPKKKPPKKKPSKGKKPKKEGDKKKPKKPEVAEETQKAAIPKDFEADWENMEEMADQKSPSDR